MAFLYPTKTLSTFGDWLTLGSDYVVGIGFFLLIGIFATFFKIMYDGRNLNSAFTGSMWITTLVGFVFFWLDFLHPDVVAATIVLTILGVFATFVSKRAGA